MPIEYILLGVSLLLILSVVASKVTDRFGIPALLLFLGLGMLAGSEGIGGIFFDDPALAQYVGIVSLVMILFAGGMETPIESVRPVIRHGVLLSTLGVVITATVLAVFSQWILGFTLLQGLLLGAIVSSTDAAAVFSILSSKGVSLKGRLVPLLELESGSNDPMAVFLTTSMIMLVQSPDLALPQFLISFLQQLVLGGLLGVLLGWVTYYLINQLRLGHDGLYPVLTMAMALFTYALTDWIGGSGFLAVYLAGIVLSRHDFIHKNSLVRFHDGLAWLVQIVMFLTLGLLVFPSRLFEVAIPGMLLALALMLIARPAGVLISLFNSSFDWRKKTFISWVGLRGAAPIVLATFPLIAGVPEADLIFHVIFFVVLTSVLLQGTSIPLVARWLKVDAPAAPRRLYPIEFNKFKGLTSELAEMPIPTGSLADGRRIVEMDLPDEFLVILIARGEEFLVPSGGTTLQGGDVMLVLSEKEAFERVKERWMHYPIKR
jgi:potassium/hydrogen antiporter